MTIKDHRKRRHRCTWKHLETDSSVASTKAERCFTRRKLLIAVINGFHTRLRRVEGPRDALSFEILSSAAKLHEKPHT